ncbi:MAG TPA: DUF2905 domain-containing protein [Syntrophothermus lipocalidus]|uniref:DUF2905 domain-containing protein n=1 Tax=Syntrophothermus lipocalidus (strain DSM 12680 / TGB-C1) TaxID=643648 RepID=D7CLE0_SYNLT|nr:MULTISPECIES: DUF2905 domain-containing protein [Syntrophothermus]ADI01525.1 conserved hypothetical protein [Syntrophothermus lipocalidus DSM 12680]NSW83778.1 DUF2905 domain-containing protein [Syntrophothermus sp.]HHV76890.1 DUF2905 domain-containing protein [Syntrophothermus lipocalidus]HOV43326.1 DUF2905 domain-containing protein [Syntrophothermus lipocalidus]
MEGMAKLLIVSGLILVVLGMVFLGAAKFGGSFRLPGDIYYHRGNFTFYFPVVTCIVLSLILTFLLNLFWRR